MFLLNRVSSRGQAVLCALFLIAAVVICHPVAEIGIYDDWSYVRTAQLLSQTGHIHYNGWATAMLGWQLVPAAALIRVFGFSFLAARIATMLIAASTVALLHRCGVRCGLSARNATFLSLTIAGSPIFLPLATTYMSDMYGLIAMVGCLYCCLRSLSATRTATISWLAAATCVGIVGGTARQTAWLGALILVPTTVWFHRSRRTVVFASVGLWLATLLSIVAAIHWYKQQPFGVPETFEALSPHWKVLWYVGLNLTRLALETGLFILPVLVLFVPLLRMPRARWIATAAAAVLLFLVALHGRIHLGKFLLPTLLDGGNYLSLQGMLTTWPEHGSRPAVVSESLRPFLTLAVLAGFLGVVVCVAAGVHQGGSAGQASTAWKRMLILLTPLTVAYVGLLIPRAAAFHLYDRYGLPLLVFGGLLLTGLYQEKVRPDIPKWAYLLMLFVALYSMAVTHDMFALFRGTEQAISELNSAGVPRTAIDGGWEYEGWTQITASGYVHEPRLHLPGDSLHPAPDPRPCPLDAWFLFPDVQPRYALTFGPDMCGGRTAFPPVTFRSWLPLRRQVIYVVRNDPK